MQGGWRPFDWPPSCLMRWGLTIPMDGMGFYGMDGGDEWGFGCLGDSGRLVYWGDMGYYFGVVVSGFRLAHPI